MHVSPRTWTGPELSALWLRTRWLAPEAWHFQDMRACALPSCRPGQHTAPGRRPMRRKIFRLEPVDQGEGRNPFRLPCLCQYCAHALEPGKLSCVQGLELPAYGGFCAGFTLARKTDGNERAQKALPSCEACRIMRAPKNTKRRSKSLSNSPRVGKILVTAFADFTCRFFGQVFAHIGQICNVRGPVRARRLLTGRGALQICPFSFPNSKRFSYV